MVKLTPSEAQTYEGIKEGLDTLKIAKRYRVSRQTVQTNISRLIAAQMITREGKNRNAYIYTALDKPYMVEKRAPADRVKLKYTPLTDPLIDKALNVELSDEQKYYLKQHRNKQPRTLLAKRLGISKLQLNFALERLG